MRLSIGMASGPLGEGLLGSPGAMQYQCAWFNSFMRYLLLTLAACSVVQAATHNCGVSCAAVR